MGGRGSRLASRSSATSAANTASMAGGGSGGAPINPNTLNQAQLQQQMPTMAQQTANNANFSDTDNSPFHQLYNGRQYYQMQNLGIDARTALVDYLDPNPTPGSLYNFSQNMNYAIAQGANLTPQQQFAYDSIQNAMHNLGYNVNLTRYDHGDALDGILQQIGVSGGHAGLSIGQLKAALVGQTYSDNRILSTSYNNFNKSSSPSTFTSREIKFTYEAQASTQVVMPGRSQIGMNRIGRGDDFGEMLLGATGTNGGHNGYTIKDVRYSGSSARAKGSPVGYNSLKQIEIVVSVG